MTVLTCVGSIFDENSGASMNSGATRASTRKKPVTLAGPIACISTVIDTWLISR